MILAIGYLRLMVVIISLNAAPVGDVMTPTDLGYCGIGFLMFSQKQTCRFQLFLQLFISKI